MSYPLVFQCVCGREILREGEKMEITLSLACRGFENDDRIFFKYAEKGTETECRRVR